MPATKLSIYQEAIRLFGDARLDVITDAVESRYALDDAWDGVVAFCLRAAPWRFALKTGLLGSEFGSEETSAGVASVNGFAFTWTKPTNWLRTHALFVLNGALERPVDAREGDYWIFTNARDVVIRFIDADYADIELTGSQWPEHFTKAVAAQLAFQVCDRLTNSAAAGVRMTQIYGTLMQEAIVHDALPEDPWLRFQLDGRFQEAVLFVLEQGYWRHALKTIELRAEAITADHAAPDVGYPYSYPQPSDWLRSHALFLPLGDGRERPIDIKEAHEQWNTHQQYFAARYVSHEFGTDPLRWQEPFLAAILAYLAPPPPPTPQRQGAAPEPSGFVQALGIALAAEAEPEDPWLRFQLDGSFLEGARYVLAQGFWRFALRGIHNTSLDAISGPGPVSTDRRYKPRDWLRTYSLYVLTADDVEQPFDIKEHHTFWGTDQTDWWLRYVSTDGLDPAIWPEPFLVALLAYLTPPPPTADQQGRHNTAAAEAAPFMTALGAALAVEAEPESPWLRYQLDGSFQRAVLYVLEQGFWRFALKGHRNTELEAIPGPGPIATDRRYKPADWMRTYALFVLTPNDVQRPFDIRERSTFWATDQTDWWVLYISTENGIDPLRWPQPFMAAVLAYLTPAPGADQQGRHSAQTAEASPFQGALGAALLAEAEPDDEWLRYQLDGSFQEAVLSILVQGNWRFAIRGAQSVDMVHGDEPGTLYSYRPTKPADWLRTVQLFIKVDDQLERPFDIREHFGFWATNAPNFFARWVGTDFGLDPLRQTEPFLDVVQAYLSTPPAIRDQPQQQQQPPSRYAMTLATALLSEAEPEDEWLRYQLDGSFQQACHYVLAQGAWRFAIRGAQSIDMVHGTEPGLLYNYRPDKPTDWLRTVQLFIKVDPLGEALERPFDIREHYTYWATNAPNFFSRFVSTDFGLDPTRQTQPFLDTVLAYLTAAPAERQDDPRAPGARITPFATMLGNALAIDGEPEDEWLRYQLDGSFQEGLLYILKQGYWDFTLRTIEFTAAPITDTSTATPIIGYPNSYPQPDDMLRSHAFFIPAGDGREYPIDIKEDANQWSTTANYFAVRYVSAELGLRPELWQEPFLASVLAYLQLRDTPEAPQQVSRTTGQAIPAVASFRNTLQAALAIDASPENPWYRFCRTGAFLRACFHVAETGRWKFAINTLALEADAWVNEGSRIDGTLPANVYGDGSISPSYAAVFAKPADWLKTIWIYRIEKFAMPSTDLEGWPERYEVDYRDELGNWHCNWKNIQVRYIRRAAIESPRWPQSYADAVLAWLEYEEARTDPKATAIAAAKQRIYEDAVDKAAKSDDMQEFPPYRRVGHLVRGRYYRARGTGAQNFLGPR